MKILGLDEAGRGCVLGPLVVGAFCCTDDNLENVVRSGATDSKKLSKKKRQQIIEKLPDLGQTMFLEITPKQIDEGNLNVLEEGCFIELILHFEPDAVYIDAPTHRRGIPALTKRLESALRQQGMKPPTWVIEPKADLNYPVVGAASIVAKVRRDSVVSSLGDVGSGYPSDPKTRKWLKGFVDRNEAFPSCVRTRWGTISDLRQQRLL